MKQTLLVFMAFLLNTSAVFALNIEVVRTKNANLNSNTTPNYTAFKSTIVPNDTTHITFPFLNKSTLSVEDKCIQPIFASSIPTTYELISTSLFTLETLSIATDLGHFNRPICLCYETHVLNCNLNNSLKLEHNSLVDTDGDGIDDEDDLDNDNDGITDADECSTAINYKDSFETPGITALGLGTDSDADGEFDILINQTSIGSWNAVFGNNFDIIHDLNNPSDGLQSIDLYGLPNAATIQKTFTGFTPGKPVAFSVDYSSAATLFAAGVWVNYGSGFFLIGTLTPTSIAAPNAPGVVGQSISTVTWSTFSRQLNPTGTDITIRLASTTIGFIQTGVLIDNVKLSQGCVDTDNDGLTDNYDNDSDGDGCSDADEAYYGLLADADPDNDGFYGTGTPSVDSNGQVIGAGYNTTNNYYKDATINTCSDNDNDGVADFADLDDDNDGITDDEECTSILAPISSTFSYSYAQDVDGNRASHFGDQGTGNNDDPENIFDGDLTTELRMHEDDFIEFNIGQTISAGTTFTLTEAGGGNDDPVSIYISLGTTDAAGDANSGAGNGVGYENAVTNAQSTLIISSGNTNQTLTFTAPIDFDHIQFLGISNHGGWAEMNIDPANQTGVNYANCDTDGDSIPNHLDTDSDGDGCSDADEAYFGLITDADPDNDGVYGTGAPTVDSNGQVIGAGYNTTNDYYKDATSNTCLDNDNDGVPDFADLDDDNDGITDDEECTQEVTFTPIASTFSYSYAQEINGNEADHFGEQGTGNNDDPERIFDGNLGTELRMHEDDFIEFNMGQTIPAGATFTLTEAGGGNDDPVSIYISLGTTDAAGDTNSGAGNGVGYENAVTNGQSVLVIDNGDSNQTLSFTAPIAFDHIQFLGISNHGGWAEMSFDPATQNIVDFSNCDLDGDGIPNHFDLDSDGDGCADSLEAGFTDPDSDGVLGNSPVSVDANGLVTGQGGYLTPADSDSNSVLDYLEVGPDANANGISDVCEADLSLSKGVNNSRPVVGDVITFQLVVTNDGPSVPTNIIVRDIIPGDFTYTHPDFTTTQGTVTFNSGTRAFEWNLGSYMLPVGSSISLTYNVSVDVCGQFTNSAEIVNSSLTDSDSIANNNN